MFERTYKGTLPPPVSERPKCENCAKPLRPSWQNTICFESKTEAKQWTGAYDSYGHFCTLRCGTQYANEMIDRNQDAVLMRDRLAVFASAMKPHLPGAHQRELNKILEGLSTTHAIPSE